MVVFMGQFKFWTAAITRQIEHIEKDLKNFIPHWAKCVVYWLMKELILGQAQPGK